MSRHGPVGVRNGHLRPGRAALTLFVGGLLFWLLCQVTAAPSGGDFFDSPYYWWGWLVLPAFTGLVAWRLPSPTNAWFGLVVVVPQAVAVTLLGTVFHDPASGASLWIAGLVFVALQGAVATLTALLAGGLRERLRRH